MDQLKILAPCGILGYGFPEASFRKGIEDKPDAIIVDAGSTDAGPHKLGAGVAIVSRQACKKDLLLMITSALDLKIPLIVGSAGGSGAKTHTDWTMDIVYEILKEEKLDAKINVIWADIPKERIKEAIDNKTIRPLGNNVPDLTEEELEKTNGVVAQMGVEPILEALKDSPDIIICGRAYDPAPFAAFAIHKGFDPALAFHLGKILECGALCAIPGTTKDSIMGVLEKDSFYVYPTNPDRKCTVTSVAAHTFYEKDHPYLLQGPGIVLNLKNSTFTQMDDRTVRVAKSEIKDTEEYQVKLEGAKEVAYRTLVIAGVRDPLLIAQLEHVEDEVTLAVKEYYKELDEDTYKISFTNYGLDGVMGVLEPDRTPPKEVGVLFEVTAKTQDLSSAICSSLRSTFMHYGYEGRKSTSGNLALPYSPSDIEFGPVYEFSVYHLMTVKDGSEVFPISTYEVKNG